MRTIALAMLLLVLSAVGPAFAGIEGQGPGSAQEAQMAAPAPGQELPKPIVVTGRVLAGDTGAPVKRAQCALRLLEHAVAGFAVPGNQTVRSAGGRLEPVVAITDRLGAFRFSNVPTGAYTLSCSRDGFVPSYYGAKRSDEPGSVLSLLPGQQVNDLELRLIRGGTISGAVVDEDNEPIAHAQVQAMTRSWTRGQARLQPRTTASTDDRGHYRLFDLSPGRYYVRASLRLAADNDQNMAFTPVFYPNTSNPRDAQRVIVMSGGDLSNTDFRLVPAMALIVSGHVTDQSGQPIEGAAVSVIEADAQSNVTAAPVVRTRADGRFTLPGLLPGRYRLTAMPPPRMEAPGGQEVLFGVSKLVDLGNGNLTGLVLVVGTGATVRGRVVREKPTLASEALRVMLRPRLDGGFQVPGGAAEVNRDMSFEIARVPPGEYDVTIIAAGAGGRADAPFYLEEVRAGGTDVVDRGLSVSPGSTIEVALVLDDSPAAVLGTVINERDEGVTGSVALVPVELSRRGVDRYFRSGRADEAGKFSITGVIPGEYLVVPWVGPVAQLLDPDLFELLEKHTPRIRAARGTTVIQQTRLTDELRALADQLTEEHHP